MADDSTPISAPTDSSGMDTTGGLQAALGHAIDAMGNLTPSATEIATDKADMSAARDQETQIGERQIANLEKQFDQSAPQQDTNVLGGLFPLLAIAAFGGKVTGASASAMLGSSIGMVQGYTQGKDQVYQENLAKYKDAYQKFRDNQDQIDKVYQTMRKSYADRIDGDQKALQMAYEITGNQVKNLQTLLQDHENVQQWADQVHHWNAQMDEEKTFHKMEIGIDQKKLDLENKKIQAAASNQISPAASAVLAEMVAQGVAMPPGSRSIKVLNTTMNALVDKYPNDTSEQIVSRIRSGEIDMKASLSEAQVVARKEANIEGAIQTLNRPGGLYDQLTTAAEKVDFGDSKTASQLRLAAQGKVVANPAIQVYVNKLNDTKAEFSQVLARSGMATDQVRAKADETFPATLSLEEMKVNIQASKEVAAAVNDGNQAVMDALKSGKPLSEAAAIANGSTGQVMKFDAQGNLLH